MSARAPHSDSPASLMLLLLAAAQVDDATLRQREANPEHQEAELRTALRGAVGTDSRDGAWEKFKLEALADNYGFDPRSNAKLRDMLKAAGHGPLDFCHPDVNHDPLIAQWQRGMDLQLAAGAERKWWNARASSDAPLDTYCRLVSACMIATEDAFAIEQEAVGNYEELYGGAPGAAFDFLSEFLAVATASTSDADARKLARAETRWEGTDLDDLSPAEIRRYLFVEAMRLRVAHAAPEAIEGGERGGERLRSTVVSAAGESSSIT